MARYLRSRIARSAIDTLLGHEIREISGDEHLEKVVVENVASGEHRTIDAGGLVILIGAEPRTDWLVGTVALNEEGFILTGSELGDNIRQREPWARLDRAPFLLETSWPGVFAVGDVRSGSTKMVAVAVGDSGMAVRLVAEYLPRTASTAGTPTSVSPRAHTA